MNKLRKVFEAMSDPATSKQLWALYLASKAAGEQHDYRNDNLTRQQASDLLKEFNAKKANNQIDDTADDIITNSTPEISNNSNNTNFIPATSKQLWALYLASKNAGEPHDYRGDNLSKDLATELLNQFNEKNPYKKIDFNKEVLSKEEEVAIEKAATKKPKKEVVKEEKPKKVSGDFTTNENQRLLKLQCIEQLKYYLEYILDNDIEEKKLMRDYEFDLADVYIPICNGQYIIIINKHNIKTEFYHGYSSFGQGLSFEDMCSTIRNQENNEVEHLKYENLKELNNNIDVAKTIVNNTYYEDGWRRTKYKFILRPRWYKLKNVNVLDVNMSEEDRHDYNNELNIQLSETDKKNIYKGYKLCKEHMVKRLETYLKRFGTSKIYHHTYCSDD